MRRFSLRDLVWFTLLCAALLGFGIERYRRLNEEQKVRLIIYDKDGNTFAKFNDVSDLDMGQINLDTDEVQVSRIQVIIESAD